MLLRNLTDCGGVVEMRIDRRALLSERLGLKVHHKLQSLGDRNFPFLRSRGYVYVVLATKPIRWILSFIFDICLGSDLDPAGQI